MIGTQGFRPIPNIEDSETASAGPNSTLVGSLVGSLSVDTAIRYNDNTGRHNDASAAGFDSAQHHTQFLGCCCDFRRAVLAINGISIFLRIVLMLGLAVGARFVKTHLAEIEAEIDDDAVEKELDLDVKSGGLAVMETVLEFLETLFVFFGVAGIYGALKFKQWGIITAMGFYGFGLLVTMLSFDFWGAQFYGLCVYAHYNMLLLMRAGIMTESNYHRIATCCDSRKMSSNRAMYVSV